MHHHRLPSLTLLDQSPQMSSHIPANIFVRGITDFEVPTVVFSLKGGDLWTQLPSTCCPLKVAKMRYVIPYDACIPLNPRIW